MAARSKAKAYPAGSTSDCLLRSARSITQAAAPRARLNGSYGDSSGRFLDYPVVHRSPKIDAPVSVIDCLCRSPQCDQVKERTEPLVRNYFGRETRGPPILTWSEDALRAAFLNTVSAPARWRVAWIRIKAAYERLQRPALWDFALIWKGEISWATITKGPSTARIPTDLGFYRPAQAFEPRALKPIFSKR